jgi:NIMA (never in mitosis gene a)-related kinase
MVLLLLYSIVMDFSDDGDLYQKILVMQKNKEFFSEDFIWKTLIQITLGLKSLHDLNILHRDLKVKYFLNQSANVFLNKNEVAKLGDMNVSKIAKNGLLYTQTGTPYYASPEVWKDKPYDSKSDIWSLGCVIYEMATLKPPFRAEDMDGLYKKVIKGQYSKVGNGYSEALSNVIKSMLQVNPTNRPNAKQLLRSLASKSEELGIEIENG